MSRRIMRLKAYTEYNYNPVKSQWSSWYGLDSKHFHFARNHILASFYLLELLIPPAFLFMTLIISMFQKWSRMHSDTNLFIEIFLVFLTDWNISISHNTDYYFRARSFLLSCLLLSSKENFSCYQYLVRNNWFDKRKTIYWGRAVALLEYMWAFLQRPRRFCPFTFMQSFTSWKCDSKHSIWVFFP